MKTYKSKLGFGLILPALTFLCILLNGINQKNWFIAIISVICLSFIFYLSLTTKYVISNGTLNIKSSFLYNLKIDIKTIRKISETNNILSSLAASIDRLEILYNKYDSVMVSPQDKNEFIKNLTDQAPVIQVNYKTKKNGESATN